MRDVGMCDDVKYFANTSRPLVRDQATTTRGLCLVIASTEERAPSDGGYRNLLVK